MKKVFLTLTLVLILSFMFVFADDGAVIVEQSFSYDVKRDGSFENITYLRAKILKDSALKDFLTQKFPYHRRYNKIEVISAKITSSDGKVRELTPSQIKDTTMAETQMMNIYEENFRVVTLNFSGLKPGDTVEMKIKIISKPLVKNNFTEMIPFQSLYPVKETMVKLTLPDKMKLKWKLKNGKAKFSKNHLPNGKIVYIWHAKDIPAYEKEPGMVPIMDSGTVLLLSTFKNWKELSAYGASLNEDKIDKNEKMVELVKELTSGKKTEKDKILAIFRWVSQNIRYMGSSMDVGALIEPHKATYTFEKKFGVCRDKSILMISMLKVAGIHAEDVIINVSRRTEPDVPTIFFEHAIVAVKYKGSFIYMDPTLELSTDFGESYIGGRYVLHLVPEGKTLKKVKDFPPEKSTGKISAFTEIKKNGYAQTEIRVEGTGYYDLILRSIGKQLPGNKQTMFLWSKIFNMVSKKAKIVEEKLGNPTDLNSKYFLNYKLNYPEYLEEYGKIYMFKIPQAIAPMDIMLGYSLYSLTRLKERKHPMGLFSPFSVKIREKIIIPDHFRVVSYPKKISYSSKTVELLLSVEELRNNTLLFKEDFSLKKSFIEPEEYKELKSALHEVEKFKKMFVIVEKKESGK